MIDEYLVDLNRDNYDDKKWQDEGIATSLSYENYREKQKKAFDERFLLAKHPPRSIWLPMVLIYDYTLFVDREMILDI